MLGWTGLSWQGENATALKALSGNVKQTRARLDDLENMRPALCHPRVVLPKLVLIVGTAVLER